MRGWTSLTTIVTDAVSVPPVFVAVIVYDADAVTVVGVPDHSDSHLTGTPGSPTPQGRSLTTLILREMD